MEEQNEILVEQEKEENYDSKAMTKKLKKKDKSHKERSGIAKSFSHLLAFVAYIGLGCIATALLLTLVLKGNTKLSDAFNAVGQVIAYVICICLAFTWVSRHRKIAWIVCYVIFVVTIVVLFILNV